MLQIKQVIFAIVQNCSFCLDQHKANDTSSSSKKKNSKLSRFSVDKENRKPWLPRIKSRGVDTIYFWRACSICTAANFNLRNGKRFCPAGPFDLFAHGLLPLLELHKRLSATFPEEREGEREREREISLTSGWMDTREITGTSWFPLSWGCTAVRTRK